MLKVSRVRLMYAPRGEETCFAFVGLSCGHTVLWRRVLLKPVVFGRVICCCACNARDV